MKIRKWFWGIILILGAVLLILSQFQVSLFSGLGPWTLAVTVFLGLIMVRSAIDLEYFGIFLPLAFLLKMDYYENLLHLQKINGFYLFLAAVLLSAGLSVLTKRPFQRWQKKWQNNWEEKRKIEGQSINENYVTGTVQFGAASKYIHSTCLENAQFSCSFGSLKLFFDHCTPTPNGAVLNLHMAFSGAELYVPKGWRIINNCSASLGGFSEKNYPGPPSGETLTIIGDISFSGVEIIYV